MNELALFAGAGGGILGGHLLGWRTVCAVEWEAYPASVLCARQNDGLLESFPVWDDVQTFDGKPWAGIVDVVSGGFPCQDISAAGKGDGLDGERSGMWKEMARIIGEVRPKYTFIENSPMLTTRGLERVLADLASMGFNAEWGVLSAADVGANHRRERIWIVGKNTEQFRFLSHAMHNRDRWGQQQSESVEKKKRTMANTKKLFCNGSNNNSRVCLESKEKSKFRNNSGTENVSNSTSIGQQRQGKHEQSFNTTKDSQRQTNYAESIGRPEFWSVEPSLGRVANGVAYRLDRLKAIGNGQVPLCAATAWRLLNERI
jgi:DNA (cytosine-5)-methyltransferase 1